MTTENLSFEERELEFNKKIVRDYLKYGSVDEVFRANHWDIPTSQASFHRLLDKWGVVKAAGPNTRLSEVVSFMESLAREKTPLETLYRKIPPSFETSKVTLHRVLSHIKKGITRRGGTALIIYQENNPEKILIGNDISVPRLEFGKSFNSISLPMGFSKKTESPSTSIKRILQREVFSDLTVERNFPEELTFSYEQFMILHFLDIKVNIYKIALNKSLESQASSQILKDLRFVTLSEVLSQSNLRSGVSEIVCGYENYLNHNSTFPIIQTSHLNQSLSPALEEI